MIRTIVALCLLLGLTSVVVAAPPTEEEIKIAFDQAKATHKQEVDELLRKVKTGKSSAKDKARLKSLREMKYVDLAVDPQRVGSFGKLTGRYALQCMGIQDGKVLAEMGTQEYAFKFVLDGVDPRSVKIGDEVNYPAWLVTTIDGKTAHMEPIDLADYRTKYGKLQ